MEKKGMERGHWGMGRVEERTEDAGGGRIMKRRGKTKKQLLHFV